MNAGRMRGVLFACGGALVGALAFAPPAAHAARRGLEFIGVDKAGRRFVLSDSNTEFRAWGFNYDHDASGRLLEDYWHKEWPVVVQDFKEMKALGANTVRVHLQISKFMKSAREADGRSLKRLSRLVELAEQTGLYLDITGLASYRPSDTPAWYDALDEPARWTSASYHAGVSDGR